MASFSISKVARDPDGYGFSIIGDYGEQIVHFSFPAKNAAEAARIGLEAALTHVETISVAGRVWEHQKVAAGK